MAKTQVLNSHQLRTRLSQGTCPICRASSGDLNQLEKQTRVNDRGESLGSFWVCSKNRSHLHYYLSKGSVKSKPRERSGAVLPQGSSEIKRKPEMGLFESMVAAGGSLTHEEANAIIDRIINKSSYTGEKK